jgi:hypothetical protein
VLSLPVASAIASPGFTGLLPGQIYTVGVNVGTVAPPTFTPTPGANPTLALTVT